MTGASSFFFLAFLFTFTLTVLTGRYIIPMLKKRAEQPIYESGPNWHMSKSGTPTMGGITFIVAISLSISIGAILEYLSGNKAASLSLVITLAFALMNASVGIIDDLTKLRHKQNAGLTPIAKLIMQFIISAAFLISRNMMLGEGTAILFSLGTIDPGFLYYPISLIIIVGITNCANLTDGIDGLASSVAFAIGASLFFIYTGKSDTVSLIASVLAAGTLGFLVFNLNPAKVFMGDTGSLFLGSMVAAISFEAKNPLISITIGGIYVIEGISVIAQVIAFKACGKRLFKMAPIHHHFEKSGWSENKICLVAIILTLLFAIPTVLICA